MTRLRKILLLLPFLATLILAGCGAPQEVSHAEADLEIQKLTRGLMALGPDVDPGEAARAARISVEYPLQLRRVYGVTDPPLVHNTKVNMGLRPRGLCYQWADDIEARLAQENFRTLELHRAIANGENELLIDHSTVIIAARGTSLFDGMIIDGWRAGGKVFWSKVLEDTRYTWVPREEVFAWRREKAARQR